MGPLMVAMSSELKDVPAGTSTAAVELLFVDTTSNAAVAIATTSHISSIHGQSWRTLWARDRALEVESEALSFIWRDYNDYDFLKYRIIGWHLAADRCFPKSVKMLCSYPCHSASSSLQLHKLPIDLEHLIKNRRTVTDLCGPTPYFARSLMMFTATQADPVCFANPPPPPPPKGGSRSQK